MQLGSSVSLAVAGVEAAAAALIWPLAWEFPYAAGVAVKREKKRFFLFQYINEGCVRWMQGWYNRSSDTQQLSVFLLCHP